MTAEPRPYHLDFKKPEFVHRQVPKGQFKSARKPWTGPRCKNYGPGNHKGKFWMRKGKPAYPYLTVLAKARETGMFFYLCPTGDHWHLTTTDKMGALPGVLRKRTS